MYKRAPILQNATIVLIREFRSPAATLNGYVREVPGGSSFKPTENPLQLAADEVHEETGLRISASRIIKRETRQLVATLSSHKAHLFSVEITDAELEWLQQQVDVAHGVSEDTERTYVEIHTLSEILTSDYVDWRYAGYDSFCT